MISLLEQEYTKLSAKLLDVSLREQFLIVFCGMVIVTLIMYTFLFEPLLDLSEKLQQSSIGAKKDMATLAE